MLRHAAAGECRQGHPVNLGLSRPQGHQAYGPLHRAVADQVQLPGLTASAIGRHTRAPAWPASNASCQRGAHRHNGHRLSGPESQMPGYPPCIERATCPSLLPAALDDRRRRRLLHRERQERAGARLRLLRRGARLALGGQSAHARRSPAHRRQHRQAAGATKA